MDNNHARYQTALPLSPFTSLALYTNVSTLGKHSQSQWVPRFGILVACKQCQFCIHKWNSGDISMIQRNASPGGGWVTIRIIHFLEKQFNIYSFCSSITCIVLCLDYCFLFCTQINDVYFTFRLPFFFVFR